MKTFAEEESDDEAKYKSYKSVTGWTWQARNYRDLDVIAIQQHYQLPEFIARLLAARNHSLNDIELFLEPKIKELLPDPAHLIDMEVAAFRLAKAVKEGEKILVFGDYDVDGATSSALMRRYFRELGQEIGLYIPDRMTEGYGPSPKAMDKIKENGYKIVITVDCGSLSFDAFKHAKEIGLEIIVVDHHLSDITLPEVVALINPNRYDQKSDYRHLAAVGVSFLLAVEINRKLESENWFEGKNKPNLLNLLDLVALGTVCDMVPLTGINRAFVKQGLKLIRNRNNVGLKKLSDMAKLTEPASCYHLGYILGPRINAGGRVGKSYLGSDLLYTEDEIYAEEIAGQLENYNNERKDIETSIFKEALAQAEQYPSDTPLIFVQGENWHPGVVGVVCGRLKEKYNKPIAVISVINGIGKASARSVYGVDFGTAIVSAKNQGLVLTGGGHAMAAGFTLDIKKIDEVYKNLSENFKEQLSKLTENKIKYFDSHLSLGAINEGTINYISKLGPFGLGNSEPCFYINDCYISRVDIIAKSHIKCIILDKFNNSILKATAFKAFDNQVGEILMQSQKKTVSLIAKLKKNCWKGFESIDLVIEDIII